MPDNKLPPLLPVRHKAPDLFSIDVSNITIKDSRHHLEFPLFSLASKNSPKPRPRTYTDKHGNGIEIHPSWLGLPTILDKDILIYAISHIVDARRRGKPASRRVVIYSADLLRFANRPLGGRDYASLERSILRLRGCTIRTNIRTGGIEQTDVFGILDSASLRRKYDLHGRLMHCEVTISEWLWNAIQTNEILTLHKDYFRLRRPLDRRLYEIARKHCGHQSSWTIGLNRLLEKSAAQCTLPYFRFQIRKVARQAADHPEYLPGYLVAFDDEADLVRFYSREDDPILITDPLDTFDESTWRAATTLAPDYDIRELNRQWLAWRQKQCLPPPRHAPSAFLGFVKAFALRRQNAAEAGNPPPRPDSETIEPKALAWWTALPPQRRNTLEHRHRAYRTQDGDFFRSDRSLIEYAYRVAGPREN